MSQQKRPPTSKGPVHGVPCPHCGRPNDLRELDGQNVLDTGAEVICGPVDGAPNTGHCGRMFMVVSIQRVVVVTVAPMQGQPRQALPQAKPAYTIGARAVRRLR